MWPFIFPMQYRGEYRINHYITMA